MSYAHWLEVLKEVGMKPVMDRNIPFTIISSIAFTVPPILLLIIIRKVSLAVYSLKQVTIIILCAVLTE